MTLRQSDEESGEAMMIFPLSKAIDGAPKQSESLLSKARSETMKQSNPTSHCEGLGPEAIQILYYWIALPPARNDRKKRGSQ
jgi:hypothetical protein